MFYRYRTCVPIIIVGIVIGIFLFIPDTFAQNLPQTTPDKDSFQIFYEALGMILNLIYITTLPLLMIAGKAMDNSMVYGEFMNLDKPLYMLRNISRTFANFAIGGMFLYNIIKYIFTPTTDSNPADVKKILLKSSIAAVAINFSWFALGALLDLSTILTYSLGSMPLSILNQFTATQANMPILSVNNFFNYESLDESNKNPNGKAKNYLYYQRGNINISPCGQDGKLFKGFVTGPQYSTTIPGKETVSFEVPCTNGDCKKYCAISTMELSDITGLEKRKEDNLTSYIDQNVPDTAEQYNNLTKKMIDELSSNKCQGGNIEFTGGINNNQTITISKSILTGASGFIALLPSVNPKTSFCSGDYIVLQNNITNDPSNINSWKKSFLPDGYNKPYSEQNGLTMTKLLDKSRGMVGVFVTLYMTLLDFSNISLNDNSNTTVTSSVGGITEFIIRAVIGILLLLPLVALSISLIMRIGLLRGLIAFAPLGIVAAALFEGGKGFEIKGLGSINIQSILGLIFAPIVPVFVLSISIIFIQALHGQMIDDIGKEQSAWGFLGMEFTKQADKNMTCADFWGLQQLCYKTNDELPNGSVFTNLFPRLFVNIFAIVIMWFLVKMSFAASPLTKGAAEGIMNLGGKLLGSVPFIPIPGMNKGVGRNAMKNANILDKVGRRAGMMDDEGEARLNTILNNLEQGKDFNEGINTKSESTNTSYTPPDKVTNFSKESELKNHLGLNNGGTLNKANTNVSSIEKLVNNDGKEKIITGSTTSEKSDQIIGILNDMFDKDKDKTITDINKKFTYKKIFHDGLAPLLSSLTSGETQETSKDMVIGFLNSPNIQKMLALDTNNDISEGIIGKINYKDKNNQTFTLTKGTGTTYTRASK